MADVIKYPIKQKGSALRILVRGEKASECFYLSIEAKTCWSGTFESWGKPASEGPVIEIAGKKFTIVLEPYEK